MNSVFELCMAIDSILTLPSRPRFSPLYQQVKESLIARLGRGDWAPGASLPSEIDLALEFGVSQGTVRKAIDVLAAENLLIRRQGRGTFVSTHAESVAQFRFLRIRPDDGDPKQPESHVLSVTKVRPPVEIVAQLQLKPNEPVFVVRRLLSFDGQATVFDEIWLSATRFKGLSLDRINAYKGPLYGLFESEFKTRMVRCEEQLRALPAEPDEAQALGIGVGEPVLVVARVSYGYDDEPVEVRKGYCLTHKYHYINSLS